jgi:LPS sulfotransferase NodH
VDDIPTPRFLCILAMARTGSTHLCHLLAACPALNVKAELFHPTRPAGRLDDDDRWGLHAASGGEVVDRASLTKWRAGHPAETLEMLHAVGGVRTLVFKLFPGHLTRERIERAILSRDDVAYLVLTRRPIECYISTVKANAAGLHHTVDTTALKPALDAEAFRRWAEIARGWYDWLTPRLQPLPHVTLRYEEQLLGLSDGEALRRALALLERLGIAGAAPDAEPASSARQDHEDDWRLRVANWESFAAALRAAPDTAALLDWALVA